jgi:hypothetical protein
MIYFFSVTKNFDYEEYEDWEFSKENKISCDEYFNELDQYIQYKTGREKNADYLGTAIKLLREGNCLSIMERQDFVYLISEFFKIYGWIVYLPRKIQNGGISILLQRKLNVAGYVQCVLMVRKICPEWKIGIKTLRDLDYMINDSKSSMGAIITTSSFTLGALEFIRKQSNRIFHFDNLIFQKRLLRLKLRRKTY